MSEINYIYCCLNDDCEEHPDRIVVTKEQSKVPEDGYDPDEPCYCCEQPMKRMGQKSSVMFKGTQEETWARQQTHFRNRAKKHAQSEEAQYEKKKNTHRELGNVMGINKKKSSE
jgi:hypothetical protein